MPEEFLSREPLAQGADDQEAMGGPEVALLGFLHQAQGDEALKQALASAPDAVAAIARAAGYPISAADLWEASDTLPEELLITEVFVFEVEDDLPN